MKKKITNFLLCVGFTACVAWAAVTDGMVALIPLILAVIVGIVIVEKNTDYVRNC